MRTDDFRINAKVRSILVRKWIDTSKCTVGTIKGKVFIRGRIKRIFGRDERPVNDDDEEDESSIHEIHELALIQQVEEEVKRIPDVAAVHFDLEYWKKEKGAWKRKVT